MVSWNDSDSEASAIFKWLNLDVGWSASMLAKEFRYAVAEWTLL